ncbi:MAG TPA: hypothetical protein VFJ82_26345 [Longimicrobium sp.]|nr:hypothetical protein [Longimicrobium sp.]
MSTAEYLSVLVSIVVGLGISHVLSGVGNLLVDRLRVRFWWVWGSAVLMVFLAHVQFWWGTFSVSRAVSANFFAFLFFLLTPITLYLSAVVLLPDFEGEGEIDLRAHFLANHRWFFGIISLVPILNAFRSVVISGDPPFNLDRVFEVTFFVLLLSAAAIGRPAYQKFIAVLNVTLFVAMVVLTSLTPG